MNLTVLLFGITTDIVGAASIQVELPEQSVIADFKIELYKLYPKLKTLKSCAFAVNEAYAKDTTTLTKSDIIALIPPVSGG